MLDYPGRGIEVTLVLDRFDLNSLARHDTQGNVLVLFGSYTVGQTTKAHIAMVL